MTEKHYSELVTEELQKLGWVVEFPGDWLRKNFKDIGPGENFSADRVVIANWDSRQRYLEAQYGWKQILDIDCRDQNPVEVANRFDKLVLREIKGLNRCG